MDKLKIKAEVREYIKIHIPNAPRKAKTQQNAKSKSPTIVHKETKTFILSQSEK